VPLRHDDLAHSDASTGEEVQGLPVLDEPTRSLKLSVDEYTSALLSRKSGRVIGRGHGNTVVPTSTHDARFALVDG